MYKVIVMERGTYEEIPHHTLENAVKTFDEQKKHYADQHRLPGDSYYILLLANGSLISISTHIDSKTMILKKSQLMNEPAPINPMAKL